jgi:hypothetical protein
MAWMLLAPLDWTVTTPVELFTIRYCWPKTKVLVTGSTRVWVVEPVKYCCWVEVTVKVVVPAAVAVVV